MSTLRFAARVRTLTTELALNESSDPSLMLKRYERQIKELKVSGTVAAVQRRYGVGWRRRPSW